MGNLFVIRVVMPDAKRIRTDHNWQDFYRISVSSRNVLLR